MKIQTFTHGPDVGWSVALPAELDSEGTLVVVFGAPEYADAPAPLEELVAAFPKSAIVGCSSAGEIHGYTIADRTLVVAVAQFERTELAIATTPIEKMTDSALIGMRLGTRLARSCPRLVLVLSDGLAVNGTDLVRGLAESLPDETMIVGGLAADGDRFARTWVLVDGVPRSGHVTAVGLSGPLALGAGSQGGWDAFGPERRVTRAHGNVLYELDGKPALALYKEYLGELASGLPATALRFPLAIREFPGTGAPVVRTILAVDESQQSLTFAGDVPNGWRARLMRSNHDRLIAGAMRAAAEATAGIADAPALALAISCVGRRLVLGARTEEETEAAHELLPPGSQQIGFYSYGEISPGGFAACELHNQTMTLTTIREIVA
ncbi:MAG TPA: FIST N-terminal domain-containing protein [Casimicrobiaceae bacterium]